MNNKPDKQILDAMSKDPQNWKGPFYFNKKDYRLIVPKLNPVLGWTINFGSPYSYMFLLSVFVIVVLAKVFF